MAKEKFIERECKHHGISTYVYVNSHCGYRCKKCRSAAVSKRRVDCKRILIEYKGGKCIRCGYDKCQDAFDFHHRDPNVKEFGLGHKGLTRSIAKLKEEADKCDLVCCRCHREIHYELNQSNRM